MAKYNHVNYTKLNSFVNHLPTEHKEQFQAVIAEGHLVARTALQASLDATDTATQSIAAAVVMRRASWL